MNANSETVLLVLILLLTILFSPVQCTDFDRNLFGVQFDPYVKYGETHRNFPPRSEYTLLNLKTMLQIVSTKFTRIVTSGVGAPIEPYVRNYTYYKTKDINTRTAEAAAQINCERNEIALTVVIGVQDLYYDIGIETELHLAVEAAQIANSIYPGTVTGITLTEFNIWKLSQANSTLFWIQKLRNMTAGLGLKIGLHVYEHMFVPKEIDAEPEEMWSLKKEILFLLDFVVHPDLPSRKDVRQEIDQIFGKISSEFVEFRNEIRNVNPKLEVMWDTKWPGREGNYWFTVENFKNYWERVNKFATENKIPVWMNGAFNNPRYFEPHSGWWKLTRNELINNVSGYIEKVSGKQVHVNLLPRLKCRKNFDMEATHAFHQPISSSGETYQPQPQAPDHTLKCNPCVTTMLRNASSTNASNHNASLNESLPHGTTTKYFESVLSPKTQNRTSFSIEEIEVENSEDTNVHTPNIIRALVTSVGSMGDILVLLNMYR